MFIFVSVLIGSRAIGLCHKYARRFKQHHLEQTRHNLRCRRRQGSTFLMNACCVYVRIRFEGSTHSQMFPMAQGIAGATSIQTVMAAINFPGYFLRYICHDPGTIVIHAAEDRLSRVKTSNLIKTFDAIGQARLLLIMDTDKKSWHGKTFSQLRHAS